MRAFLHRAQFPLLIASGLLPGPLLLCVFYGSGSLPHFLGLAGVSVLTSLLCLLIRGRARLAVGALLAAAIAWAGVAALPLRESPALAALPLLLAAFVLFSLRIGGWNASHEPHPSLLMLGVLLHALAQVLKNAADGNGNPAFAPVQSTLTISFLMFAVLALLCMNRVSLSGAAAGSQRPPEALRRRNALLTLGFGSVTLFLAALPAVGRLLRRSWNGLRALIARLLLFLTSLLPQPEGVGTGGRNGGGFFGEMAPESEAGWLALLLEKVALVLAVAAIILLGAVLLRILWRKLRVLIRRAWQWLATFAATSTEDYVDEVAPTLEDGGMVERVKRRLRRRPRPRRMPGALSPGERIRWRYACLLDRNPQWGAQQTARETLPEEAAALYERARYSDHAITSAEADRFASQTEN